MPDYVQEQDVTPPRATSLRADLEYAVLIALLTLAFVAMGISQWAGIPCFAVGLGIALNRAKRVRFRLIGAGQALVGACLVVVGIANGTFFRW